MVRPQRQVGLDILKACCIVLVVTWHLQPIQAVMLPEVGKLAFFGRQAITFFYQNISLLAVPSFILVSLYLFVGNLSRADEYWQKRFFRLIQIYAFWVGIQFIVYLLLGGDRPLPLKTILRSGGPDLPLATPVPSIFYYLYILMVSTILTLIFYKLPDKIKWLVSFVVIGGSLFYFLLTPLWGKGVDTRSMMGYYIYIPIAYYLHRYKDLFVRYRWVFFAGLALSLFYEWGISGMTSAYARLPVFFGALSAVSLFLTGWTSCVSPVRFLSVYSLGIFALHPYFMAAGMTFLSWYAKDGFLFAAGSVWAGVALFVFTMALSCLASYGLGKTRLRGFVS